MEEIMSVVGVVCLVPTTALWFFGFIFSILMIFGAGEGVHTQAIIVLTLPLLIIGYGLFSLWWLVLNFHKVTLNTIPKKNWLGLSLGIIVATIFSFPFIAAGFNSPTAGISSWEVIEVFLAIGGSPLIVLTVLVAYIWKNGPAKDSK